VAALPDLSQPPFTPKTLPLTSAIPHESFTCAEFAGNTTVEPLQGAPSPEEKTDPLQKTTSVGLETPPGAALPSCNPAAASPTTATVLR
jgi:hypothetical protein